MKTDFVLCPAKNQTLGLEVQKYQTQSQVLFFLSLIDQNDSK